VRSADSETTRARAFLEHHLGCSVLRLERIARGEWSRAFAVDLADGRQLIARFSALQEDFLKDQRVMRYASSALPLPRILHIGTAPDGAGYFSLSERIDGAFLDECDAAGFERLLPSLFRALDAMRDADVRDTTGFGIWAADGNAPHASWHAALSDIPFERASDRIHGWRPGLRLAPSAERAFAAAWDAAQQLLPRCPDTRHLVHSDLLNFNVLAADDHISGVIDWGSSLYGDFLWDLAWLTFWQPWYTAWREVDIISAARRHYTAIGLDVPELEARVRCYELCIGLDGMKYQAFKVETRASDLEWTARRTLQLCE
jgi:hygromycin-B 4-O-kinase